MMRIRTIVLHPTAGGNLLLPSINTAWLWVRSVTIGGPLTAGAIVRQYLVTQDNPVVDSAIYEVTLTNSTAADFDILHAHTINFKGNPGQGVIAVYNEISAGFTGQVVYTIEEMLC